MLRYTIPGILLLLLLLNVVQSHDVDDSTSNRNTKRASDPVSSFFSELGDLILDVDKAIAVQSQPKIEHEANIMSQLLKPRADYFERIQNNYKDMQKRLGNLIGNTIGFRNSYSDHELSTVSPPLEKFNPTIKPDHNPFAAAAEDRKEKLKQRISKTSHDQNAKHPVKFSLDPSSIPETIDQNLKAFGKLSKTIIDDIEDLARKSSQSKSVDSKNHSPKRSGSFDIQKECSNEVLEDPDLEQRRQEKCSRFAAEERARENLRKLMLEPKRATEALFSKSSDALDKLSKGVTGRSGVLLKENEQISNIDENDSDSMDDEESKSTNECSNEILEDSTLENERREKCARMAAEEKLINDLNKLLQNSKETTGRLSSNLQESIGDFSTVLLRRSGDNEDENLSNILSSDSSFNTQIRQLVKDHGSWILDYPLLKRWRQRDRSSEENSEESESTTIASISDVSEIEPTELYVPVSTDYEIALQKSGETVPGEYPHESSYYRIVNEDGDIMEDDVDIVFDPESFSHDIEALEVERQEPKETVILAFTSDGVPLKLRLGSEVDNPLQYLHKLLKSASVSLNIPVESYDDLEPVGKEVLKLGSGILTRAVSINVSNSNELKSLLKALMASKSSGKTSF